MADSATLVAETDRGGGEALRIKKLQQRRSDHSTTTDGEQMSSGASTPLTSLFQPLANYTMLQVTDN